MKKLQQEIMEFRDRRGWDSANQEKDIALSIVLEASELLEIFQWKTSDQAKAESEEHLKEEMADVLIYLIQLAAKLDVDLEEAVRDKMIKNAIKYPEPQNR